MILLATLLLLALDCGAGLGLYSVAHGNSLPGWSTWTDELWAGDCYADLLLLVGMRSLGNGTRPLRLPCFLACLLLLAPSAGAVRVSEDAWRCDELRERAGGACVAVAGHVAPAA